MPLSSEHNLFFRKVLVANRGEIARRIFRTLRQMGIRSVAVFSDADRDAPHVAEADEAVYLGPDPASESYLRHDLVLAAARATGAEAIHPGYGFLAENADFAALCGEAGVVFIGPSPEAIRRMGNKAEAKALARDLGIPVLEGFSLGGLDGATIERRAKAMGYPLLIKAAAGGGGKGMRTVTAPEELAESIAAATREAEAAFGDGSLLIEHLLASPRHVEIQILGDASGQVLHTFERDCSVQRRHQKVFEEAPSPAVDHALRQRMGEAAVSLARAVSYRGAGTVEFLLDPAGELFFLEMNTRLQVEHPVTEAVTGLDLVRLQIEIAQGQPLTLRQEDLPLTGHAIEARLYAEDPTNDFLPATGRVALWSPPELPGLRIDSGIEVGVDIGIHYDPLLAKVIAHGADRGEALRRLACGLGELAVGGLTTNRELLLAVLEHKSFLRGEVDTGFFEQALPRASWSRPIPVEALCQHAIAAALHLVQERRSRQFGPIPLGIPPAWRNNRWRPQEEIFELGDRTLSVAYTPHRNDLFTITAFGADDSGTPREHTVRLVQAGDGTLALEIDGIRRRFRLATVGAESISSGQGPTRVIVHGLGSISDLRRLPRFPQRTPAAVAGGCAAPMTGKVVQVLVAEGDRVQAGATLLVLEAMKMEHRLLARSEGIVASVRVATGQMVDPDQVLVVVNPVDGGGEGNS